MQYRRLGKTNLNVSVVGIGTWQLGGEWGKDFTQAEVDAMFDKARELGINLIDTAECYGDHTAERLVGQSIHRDREKWILATKFGHQYVSHMNRIDARSAADAIAQVEGSLKALQTDYIDLLQYHSVRNSEYDNDELTEVLLKLVQSGKVRHLGASISPNDNIHQVQQAPKRHVDVIQVVYNRLDRKPEQQVLPACQELDLGVLARVPLASGLLSGKYHPGTRFPANDFRSSQEQAKLDARMAEVQEIAQKEVPPGVPISQWALAWCLRHPAVTAVIPGCKNVTQVENNARAVE